MKISNIIKTFKIYKNPLTFYSMYLGFHKNTEGVLRLKNGLKYIVRPNLGDHLTVFESVFHSDYIKSFKQLSQKKSNQTVIDIGGHIGTFSVPVSKMAKKVYAFEPSRSSYGFLKRNIKLNNCNNIKVVNSAIGIKKTTQYLYLSNTNAGGNSLYSNSRNKQKKEKINTVTLTSQLVKYDIKKVDFMKVDCEGGEFSILLNFKKSVYKKIEAIVIEYHNHLSKKYSHLDLIEKLQENNFKVRIIKEFNSNTGIIFASK